MNIDYNTILIYLTYVLISMCWGYFNLQNGWTALHEAACSGHTEIVTALLAKGASIDIQDKVRNI